jgi:serine/threonine protein kinase/Tfp pilus assembly protein PilF
VKQWQIGDKIQNRWEIQDIKSGSMGVVYIVVDVEQKWLLEEAEKIRKQVIFGLSHIKGGEKLPPEDVEKLSSYIKHQQLEVAVRMKKEAFFAVKTMKAALSHFSQIRKRFVNEARTWIKLGDHPHIVKAHSVDIIDDQPYLFLECVEGGSLRSWIGKPDNTIEQILEFAIQLCEGMNYAHDKLSLIHRDIKPENILLEYGPVLKITDFGLAKAFYSPADFSGRYDLLVSEESSSYLGLTQSGTILGTLLYMSPEQLKGYSLDIRSDIYSFGLVLYEMLTGQHPLTPPKSNSQQEIVAFLLHQQNEKKWPPPSHFNPKVPTMLNEIVAKSLAICPEERYSDFGMLQADLRQIKVSVNKSGSDAIYREKSKIDWDATQKQRKDHRRKLDKEHLGVMKIDGLIFDEWYDRYLSLLKLGDYQAAQDAIDKSLQIIDRLIEQPGKFTGMGRTPQDIHALAYTIKGKCLMLMNQPEDALQAYNRAIELGFRIAEAYFFRGNIFKKLHRYEEALDDYTRAIHIDSSLIPAYFNRGNTYSDLNRHEDAVADYNQIINLDPTYSNAYNNRGNTYQKMLRYDEALEDFTHAIQYNPAFVQAYYSRGVTYAKKQCYHEALVDFTCAIEFDPKYTQAYIDRGGAYCDLQRYDEALKDLNHAIELDSTDARIYYIRGVAFARMQNYQEAVVNFSRAIKLRPNYLEAYYNIGVFQAAQGAWQESLSNIEKAAKLGSQQAAQFAEQIRQILNEM